MAITTAPLVKWKLKYILPNGVWLPLKTSNDIIVFGKNSSQRLMSAAKLVGGFKDPFDDAFIYEVGQNGQMVAKYDKDLRRFILK